jgi:hypothetical protein
MCFEELNDSIGAAPNRSFLEIITITWLVKKLLDMEP